MKPHSISIHGKRIEPCDVSEVSIVDRIVERTSDRLRRAINRAIRNAPQEQWKARTLEVLEHATKLGWI